MCFGWSVAPLEKIWRNRYPTMLLIEIRILVSLPIRICIIQDPALIRQICTVSVDDHYFGRNHFHFIGPILI
jgi:hypothetical protein